MRNQSYQRCLIVVVAVMLAVPLGWSEPARSKVGFLEGERRLIRVLSAFFQVDHVESRAALAELARARFVRGSGRVEAIQKIFAHSHVAPVDGASCAFLRFYEDRTDFGAELVDSDDVKVSVTITAWVESNVYTGEVIVTHVINIPPVRRDAGTQ